MSQIATVTGCNPEVFVEVGGARRPDVDLRLLVLGHRPVEHRQHVLLERQGVVQEGVEAHHLIGGLAAQALRLRDHRLELLLDDAVDQVLARDLELPLRFLELIAHHFPGQGLDRGGVMAAEGRLVGRGIRILPDLLEGGDPRLRHAGGGELLRRLLLELADAGDPRLGVIVAPLDHVEHEEGLLDALLGGAVLDVVAGEVVLDVAAHRLGQGGDLGGGLQEIAHRAADRIGVSG